MAMSEYCYMQMRVTFNAQERTLREMAALVQTAGWKIVDVVHGESSSFGHMTAVPIDIPEATSSSFSSSDTVKDLKHPGMYLFRLVSCRRC